jgi:16S rRNA (uracil1498-N3)-methyltransferase
MSDHNIFYIPPQFFRAGQVTIEGPHLRHIKNVLRKRTGEQITLTDGQGNHYGVELGDARRGKATAKIVHKKLMPRKCTVDLTVGFAVVKGLRNDVIIEKGTELGVSRFVVFLSRYSVIKHLSEQRINRFKKIAASAMIQSQQYYLPEVLFAPNIEEIAQANSCYDRILVADPSGKAAVPTGARRILLLIGPEGGFAQSEKDSLVKQSARLLSLGPTRLRSETAAIAAVSKILTVYGQI